MVWSATDIRRQVASLTSCPSPSDPGSCVRQDFACRQPIQFGLQEHVTFSPWQPLPVETVDGFDGPVVRNISVSEEESTVRRRRLFVRGARLSYLLLHLVKRTLFSDGNTETLFRYEPFCLGDASESGRNPRCALDVVITGEVCPFCHLMWYQILTLRPIDAPDV